MKPIKLIARAVGLTGAGIFVFLGIPFAILYAWSFDR
jgi:hypothetical protein